jgi:exodeoxyribonuclease III
MKLVCWNVNGLRAALGKGFLAWVQSTQPDILSLNETKAAPGQLPPELRHPQGYHAYYAAAEKAGYSGVATWSRERPSEVRDGFGLDPAFDREGRILHADFGAFVLLTIYFPNGKKDDDRLRYKLAFYEATLSYCNALRAAGRAVIVCGDLNTAHQEIDLARPKENTEISGFLPVERAWMDRFTAAGYIDTFRHLHPTAQAYSWWSLRTGARARNIGWRLDYYFISPDLLPKLRGAAILTDIHGSDHCPVSLELDL